MSRHLSPIFNRGTQFFTNAGVILAGGLIHVYLAGSTTETDTYTAEVGGTTNANPIELDSYGRVPNAVWLDDLIEYKFVLATSADVSIATIGDYVSGINNVESIAAQWVSTGDTPTYISGSSFSVPGDETAVYQVGRRIQATVTAGTVYGTITAASYGAGVTTVTVDMDSTPLDNGLSVVNVGFITPIGSSLSVAVIGDFTSSLAEAIQKQTYSAFTTAGSSTAYTLTPSPAIASLVTNTRFRVKFDEANTSETPTLAVSGLTAKNIKVVSGGVKANPAIGQLATDMLADIEYDGTDWVVLFSSSDAASASGSGSMVRQTVVSGPINSTTGVADFLPATSGSLSITSQNIDSDTPFVVTAAAGFDSAGEVNRLGFSTANLTWSGLTASDVNYLYVDIDSSGTLTAGSTILEPTYPYAGTRSTTNGQAQFNISEMSMTVGDGLAAVAAYRVFVGEVTTNGSGVTSSISYAYRGQYESADLSITIASGDVRTDSTSNHNIGVTPKVLNSVLKCAVTQYSHAVGDEVPLEQMGRYGASGYGPTFTQAAGRLAINSANFGTGTQPAVPGGVGASGTPANSITASSWRLVHRCSRGW